MRGWKERRRAREQSGEGRAAIRATRRAYLAGETVASETPEPPEPIELNTLSWNELRAVAKRVRGGTVRNKADAVAAIEVADEAAFRAAFRDVT
ncbi:MAG: hypothetical protein AAFX92_21100, partial [Pseudomonadota bacterium]